MILFTNGGFAFERFHFIEKFISFFTFCYLNSKKNLPLNFFSFFTTILRSLDLKVTRMFTFNFWSSKSFSSCWKLQQIYWLHQTVEIRSISPYLNALKIYVYANICALLIWSTSNLLFFFKKATQTILEIFVFLKKFSNNFFSLF